MRDKIGIITSLLVTGAWFSIYLSGFEVETIILVIAFVAIPVACAFVLGFSLRGALTKDMDGKD